MVVWIVVFAFAVLQAHGQDREMIPLWPGAVPGEVEAKAPAVISPKSTPTDRRIARVTDPALVVYAPESGSRNGAAVVVCPGGGYNILAIDKEGYEIGEWLSEVGYTAFVLHYRVPKKKAGALQDAARAVRMVRGMREQWGIESDRIGVLGFSAGGSLAARLSTRYDESLYEPVDDHDQQSARPDFSVLIYPAYLDQGPDKSLTPEIKLTEKTPPMFLFVSADDPYANSSLVMGAALREAKIPFELHILPDGGHGFGMRPGKRAPETWPKLCQEWLEQVALATPSPNS